MTQYPYGSRRNREKYIQNITTTQQEQDTPELPLQENIPKSPTNISRAEPNDNIIDEWEEEQNNRAIEQQDQMNDSMENLPRMATTRQIIKDGRMTTETFRKAQEIDIEIQKIMELRPLPSQFAIKQGLLVKKTFDKNGFKNYILKSLINTILFSYHHSIFAIHRSPT